ncbi:hypothetical protein Cycma_3416 [Cyclobacterium marinum DSM 745]|uniref:Uncharacterized protein n=1 Tax=Cyclobacterium marinum (strain ATCC 25205 / DSM 745 / LMG 13164 / NCIMB 1802) TaxID=880070 RepID=G0IWF1_CYCMS|nr:hypothetical protein Cycma_3416 [Cyclobacterium marinum DSM 745]
MQAAKTFNNLGCFNGQLKEWNTPAKKNILSLLFLPSELKNRKV